MENTRVSTTHGYGLLGAVVLVALNLRPSMAAVGPLLSAIRGDVPLSFGMASLLTMLPVMAMGAAMFTGMRVAQWLGAYRTLAFPLLAIGIATLSRLWLDSALQLILSAMLAGVGIALIQALMPVLIKSRFSHNVSLCMGLYVTSIMGGAALAASFSPLVLGRTGSWRAGLAIWAVLAVVGLLIWIGQRSVAVPPAPAQPPSASGRKSIFRIPRAWTLGLFFGLGTASYTCVLAWLAPYYVEQGWSEQNSGLLLGFLTAMEVLSGLVAPAVANRSRDRRAVIAVLLT